MNYFSEYRPNIIIKALLRICIIWKGRRWGPGGWHNELPFTVV